MELGAAWSSVGIRSVVSVASMPCACDHSMHWRRDATQRQPPSSGGAGRSSTVTYSWMLNLRVDAQERDGCLRRSWHVEFDESDVSHTHTRDLSRRTLACLGAHLALTRFRISIDMFLPQTDQSQSVAIGEDRERASVAWYRWRLDVVEAQVVRADDEVRRSLRTPGDDLLTLHAGDARAMEPHSTLYPRTRTRTRTRRSMQHQHERATRQANE